MPLLQPPAGFIERLRAAVDDPSLEIEFNPEDSAVFNRPIWDIFYKSEDGQLKWLCDWRHPLDGAVDAIVRRMAEWDFRRVGGSKAYYAWLDQKTARAAEARRKVLADAVSQDIPYVRKLWRAYLDENGSRRTDMGNNRPSYRRRTALEKELGIDPNRLTVKG